MARKHRICNACGKQIKRGEHWREVNTTPWNRFVVRLFTGRKHPLKVPQHWNCLHPTRPSPHTFVGVEKQLNHDTYMDGEGDNQRLHSTVEREFGELRT